MLVGCVVFSLIVCPVITGQMEQFDQECNILRKLDALEARLQEQESRLKDQENLLKQQEDLLNQQNSLIEHCNSSLNQLGTLLEHQNVSLGQIDARMKEQEILMEQQNDSLRQQELRLKEQEIFTENQNISLKEQDTRLKQQETLNGNQKVSLEQQEGDIRELEARQSSQDHVIGFTATSPAETGVVAKIRFAAVITNEGGGYDVSTGKFTCTVAGFYSFNIHLITDRSSSSSGAACFISKNNEALVYASTDPATAADGGIYGASTSVVMYLSPGDTVYPNICTKAYTMHVRSSFSGFLIRAM